jgi:hypothetical protein
MKNKQEQAMASKKRVNISSLNFEWAQSRGGRRERDITHAPLVPARSKNGN